MRYGSFAQVTPDEGAAALNRVFENYLLPFNFSSEQLQLHTIYNDVAAPLSPIWFDEGGAVVAAALLAVREKRGWIGGFGVAQDYRGRGYAKALIEGIVANATEHGIESISLEVLANNTPALNLYQTAGFQIVRRLLSFHTAGASAVMPGGFRYVPPDEIIDEPESVRPCWQRETASLRNGAASTAVRDDTAGFALFRHNATLAQVLKMRARDARALTAIAAAVGAQRDLETILVLNEPEESPLVDYAHAAGWDERIVQYEMNLTL
jgi:GNAT superfamily N-acetyltransferase